MEESVASAGCLAVTIGSLLAIFALVALGRIWLYAKEQVELLTRIEELVRASSGSAARDLTKLEVMEEIRDLLRSSGNSPKA
ncbi:MAG: hypothetical protein KY459_11990 [Acidobacteria bacterium]|nr:hypothetical protein [Acidobacteriota bacterium]